jgi:hypothetical protein
MMLQLSGVDEFQLARKAVFSGVAVQLPYIGVGYLLRFEVGREGNVCNQPPVMLKELRNVE